MRMQKRVNFLAYSLEVQTMVDTMQPGPNKNAPDFVHQNTDILDVQILQQNRAYAAPFLFAASGQ